MDEPWMDPWWMDRWTDERAEVQMDMHRDGTSGWTHPWEGLVMELARSLRGGG